MGSIRPPRNEEILAFWSWFEAVAAELGEDFDNPPLLEELDAKVLELGDVAWELGPGPGTTNALVISPDGAREWLDVTQRIILMAPEISGWEFLPARPPRAQLEFTLSASGTQVPIDANSWRYVLYRFPDRTFDLVLEQNNLQEASDHDRYTAAVVLIDGLLGEARRLLQIRTVEPVVSMTAEQAAKANPVTVLADHLDQLVRDL